MKISTLWHFFASVRLAIFILSCLVISSMIGTVIPQGKTLQFYTLEYGENLTRIFQFLHFPDLYDSWWFIFLLGLLCTNLIICSLERFPAVWEQMHSDGCTMPLNRLKKLRYLAEWREKSSLDMTSGKLARKLETAGWKSRRQNHDHTIILFAQKGKYTRLGVYLIHSSILIILTGAIIGRLYGFKTHIMLPETEQISRIVSSDGTKQFDPGFTIRCDSFSIERYPSGIPKNYRSRITIVENGKVVASRDVQVNSPLKYKGITFYQSDFEAYNDFIFSITNRGTGNNRTFIVPFGKEVQWQEEGIGLGVINAEMSGQSVSRIKVWFSAAAGTPVQRWLGDNFTTDVKTESTLYTLHVKQLYATGLQVSKDPGVWVVYIGFGLMLSGLLIAFFMSHRRIWLYVQEEQDELLVVFAGSSNKHRDAFLKSFNMLAETLQK